MITNTLLIKLKNRETAAKTKETLLSMKGRIEALREIQVELDINHGNISYDVLLITRFSSMDDMRAYAAHPVHVEVSKYIAEVTESLAAVCYDSI